jgi:hypothetical protein
VAKLSDLDVAQRSRRLFTGAFMLVVGGVIGFALPHHNAFAQSQTGTVSSVTVGKNGAATVFTFTRTGGQPVRLWAPAVWQATPTGAWHTTGLAPCLTAGKKVTLGMVDASSSAPSSWVVTSVTCNAP